MVLRVNAEDAVTSLYRHRGEDGWSVALFQTTPAQFHGRPELSRALTVELAELLTPPSG